MPTVNGIQSTAFSAVQPPATPGGGRQRSEDVQNANPAVDTYSRGSESWRNKAMVAVGQTACRCGNCPACAAQAYATQGQPLNGSNQDATAELPPAQGQGGAEGDEGSTVASEQKGVDGEVLSQQEQARLAELKKIDQEVRAHEQAHMAAAGGLVRRGISLSYEKGPDGRRYAVGGEVSIDTSKEAEPADTIAKMRTVRAAALAPAEPSPQDRKVAAAATVTMTDAMYELRMEGAAGENGENAVKQAAERMAGPSSEGSELQAGLPGESVAGQEQSLPPAGRRGVHRYAASSNTPPPRLVVTA